MKLLLPAVTLATLLAGTALADCTNPAATMGTMTYNVDYSVVQVCNGTSWVALGGNGNNGAGEVDPQVGTLTDGKWCTASSGVVNCTSDAPTASVALDDLTDVATAGAATGSVIAYNGSSWVVSSTLNLLSQLGDVTISSPASGNVLHYNGTRWVNTPIASLVTASGDRIVSGTSGIVVQSGGVISITTNGSTANYFNTSGQFITTGIGIGVATPSASIHVSGTGMFKTASASNSCSSDEWGALRFNDTTKRLQVCRQPQ